MKEKPDQIFGIEQIYAFGEFTFDTTVADPTVQFQLIDDQSKVLFETRLTRSQLTPGAGKAK